MPNLVTRSIEWIRRLFRREPAPGHWEEGSTFALGGFIAFRPWVLPRRHYRLYVPRGRRWLERAPLIVLLHGCKQTPDDVAKGTRIAALADAQRAFVLMPDQADAANPYRCWNWFDTRTAAGRGEAAIIEKMIRKVSGSWRIDPTRVVAAGISAGASLAAILGVRYPRLVSAVVSHSGLACGAAATPMSALNVMKRGPDADVARIAREARPLTEPVCVPLLVIHGMVDDVVAPRNAAALARQYLVLNGIAVPEGDVAALPAADFDARDAATAAHVVRTREWRRESRTLVRLVEIEGLGHAWSGGDPALMGNDGTAPDATAMIGAWLAALPR